MTRPRTVAVLGGGIGGLAAALAFARRGAEVALYEQAPAFEEVGAGIQITPNGACVLRALGLEEEAEKRSLRAEAVEPMDGLTGQPVTRFDLSRAPGPYRFFHRAALVEMLAEACRDAGVALTTDARVEEVSEWGFLVGGEWRTADVVTGAEGIRSLARRRLNGEDQARFSGQVAFRALVPASSPPRARIWMAPGGHVVTYPLPEGLLNLVAVRERDAWRAEGWHHEADPEDLRREFAQMTPTVRKLLDRVETVREWGLFLHPVARRWHAGPLAILGDAAHPTLPFLAQGANLALEDAWVLAREYMEGGGGARYQKLRQRRVARALGAARANATNYHLAGPKRFAAHRVLSTVGCLAPDWWMRRLDWLYGHDVTA